MPRFYFSLWDGVHVRDDEGLELDDIEAARAEARRGAAEVIAEHIKCGEQINPNDRVVAESRDRRVLLTIRFGDLIEMDI